MIIGNMYWFGYFDIGTYAGKQKKERPDLPGRGVCESVCVCVWTRGEERVRYDLDHHSYEEYLLTGQRKNQDKQKSSRGNWG